MNTNFGTFIDREGWEARIVDPFSPMAVRSREVRNFSKEKDNLTERGFVVWDKMINQSVFLPAVGALEILKDMREVRTWKRNGMVIGAPALTSTPQDEKTVDEEILCTPFIRRHPKYVLSEPLRLTPEQLKDLFDFLLKNGQLLTELAEKDEIVARQQLTDLFKKIAEYRRKKGWANLNSSFRTMNWLTRRGIGRSRTQEIICRIGAGFRS